MYCSRCKIEGDIPMTQYSKNKDGTKKYYHCRKCNTDRHKKYRATQNGGENIRQAVKKSIEKHWHKQKARLKLIYEIRMGRIKRPETCSACKETKNIEAHHTDYTKPLEVIWVCRQCHCELDKQMVK